MWMKLDDLGSWRNLRHYCDMGDQLDTYGYILHDGHSIAIQKIRDAWLDIQTTFVRMPATNNNGTLWMASIEGNTPRPKSFVHFFPYVLRETKEKEFFLNLSAKNPFHSVVNGFSDEFGDFSIVSLARDPKHGESASVNGLVAPLEALWSTKRNSR
jgi:hypothetical protein